MRKQLGAQGNPTSHGYPALCVMKANHGEESTSQSEWKSGVNVLYSFTINRLARDTTVMENLCGMYLV